MDRRTFLAVAATSSSLPAFGQKKETIRIVSSLPRTGGAKGQTEHIVYAIRMAIAEREIQFPFKIEHLDWDDATAGAGAWTPELEAQNAQKTIADPDVMAYLGPYNSGAARVSMPILNEGGVVQVSPTCTYPGLTRKPRGDAKSDEPEIYRPSKKTTFCRVCPHDDSQGPLTARFVASELKGKSVFVLDDREMYGAGIAGAFADACKELKIKVIDHVSINPTTRDFLPVMMKVKKAMPDVVYFGGTTQSGGPQIARDFTASGMTCPLLVPDGCYELAFISATGKESLKNCYVTIGGLHPNSLEGRGRAFTMRYRKTFQQDPEAYAIYGYEAAAVVLEGIRVVAKKDREAIRKAVIATKDFEKGALPKWSFDPNGDTTLQQTTVTRIEDGKFKPVNVLSAGEK